MKLNKVKMRKLVALGAFALVTLSTVNNGQANHKITICHNNHSITIDMHALPAHMAHGDDLWGCSNNDNIETSGPSTF